jgi:putative transposase
LNHKQKVALIEKYHPSLSINRQAQLLSISRSSIYYQPRIPVADIELMHEIDEIYTQCPFYGSRRIKWGLLDDYDKIVGRDHVRRLMRIMGLEAIYPKKKTSSPNPQHRIYPYLLKNLAIIRPNQVWGTDITYIKLQNSFCYLTAILDWYSRYVVAWQLSDSLGSEFCLQTLSQALELASPEIHNSDQGVQFTCHDYVDLLANQAINISMDGRGRCMDNIFTERLWRSLKYENVYLNHYSTMNEANQGLTKYFDFYNTKRRHQSLNYQTPETIYFS